MSMALGIVLAPYVMAISNEGASCYTQCGDAAGSCPGFCGSGACCRNDDDEGGHSDSSVFECGFGNVGCDAFHCCVVAATAPVAPPPPAIPNAGQSCYSGCGNAVGACPGFCGATGACCRNDEAEGGHSDSTVFDCGFGTLGCDTFHCCVIGATPPLAPPPPTPPPPYPPVPNESLGCYTECGAAGLCLGHCGSYGACCRSDTDPDGVRDSNVFQCGWGTLGCDTYHCCVLSAGAAGDPHITFANGGKADFRGSHRDFYAFVSSPGYQFAPRFQEVDFWFDTVTGLKQLVHGTFMTRAAWRVRTSLGKELYILADAMKKGELSLRYRDGAASAPLQTVAIKPWQKHKFDDVSIETRMLTASVENPVWQINVTSKPVYGQVPPLINATHTHGHWEEDQRRFDILIQGEFPQPDAHGIVGQSYRDATVRNGKMDEYGIDNFTTIVENADSDGMLPPLTTSAQAEGAIEGVHTDYKLSAGWSTDFAFSRFRYQHHRANDAQGVLPKALGQKRTASTREWDGEKWAGNKREL